jgi:tartrate dehydratase beta subunit/fumarate hydratase class I family protein
MGRIQKGEETCQDKGLYVSAQGGVAATHQNQVTMVQVLFPI